MWLIGNLNDFRESGFRAEAVELWCLRAGVGCPPGAKWSPVWASQPGRGAAGGDGSPGIIPAGGGPPARAWARHLDGEPWSRSRARRVTSPGDGRWGRV